MRDRENHRGAQRHRCDSTPPSVEGVHLKTGKKQNKGQRGRRMGKLLCQLYHVFTALFIIVLPSCERNLCHGKEVCVEWQANNGTEVHQVFHNKQIWLLSNIQCFRLQTSTFCQTQESDTSSICVQS